MKTIFTFLVPVFLAFTFPGNIVVHGAMLFDPPPVPRPILVSGPIVTPGSSPTTAATNDCITYGNFNFTEGLNLVGSAAVTNGMLRLTPAIPSQTGDAWLITKQPCTNGFDTTFQFAISVLGNIYGNELGGDGFTFAVQNLGPTNESWAMGDTNQFVAVFFNTFWNWPGCTCPDVSDNSIGLLVNQIYVTQTDLNPLGINMSDGAVHQAHITYNGADINVWVDGVMILTNVALPGLQPGVDASGRGWVGFTAGTGAAYENHDILDWSFCLTTNSSTPIVNPPVITSQPTNQTVLEGGSAVFSAAAEGTGPLSYQWQFDGTPIPGATGTSLTLTNLHPDQTGNYAVLVSNSGGSITSFTALLTVTTQSVLVYDYLSSEKVITAGQEFSYNYSGKMFLIPGSTNGFFVGWATLHGQRQYWITPFSDYLLATIPGADNRSYTVFGKAGDEIDAKGQPHIWSYLHEGENTTLRIATDKTFSFPETFSCNDTQVYPNPQTGSMVLREAVSTYQYAAQSTQAANNDGQTVADLMDALTTSLAGQGYKKQ